MTDKRFEELLIAYHDGDISEEQVAELHRAVHESDDCRRRFQEDCRIHVLLREALVEQVELKALQDDLPRPASGVSRSPTRRRIIVAATLAVAAVVAGAWVYREMAPDGAGMGICLDVSGGGEVRIERGSRRLRALPEAVLKVGDRVACGPEARAMLQLADGSILSVEPGASLTLLSDRPQVELDKGETLFEIAAREPGMPAFEVRTGQSTVAVMGTVFTLEANGHTRLKVYEGRVTLTRHRDKASVEVGSQQTTTTEAEDLTVEELSTPTPEPITSIISLLPTDDVTLERNVLKNEQHLKVRGNDRTVYLRFVVPDVGPIRSARLRLTQDIDTGAGALRFFVGDHSDWNEGNLTKDGAPVPGRKVAQHNGVVRRDQVVEVDVSDAIEGPGPLTIVITLDKPRENDIWFGSKESDVPPELILTHLSQPSDIP